MSAPGHLALFGGDPEGRVLKTFFLRYIAAHEGNLSALKAVWPLDRADRAEKYRQSANPMEVFMSRWMLGAAAAALIWASSSAAVANESGAVTGGVAGAVGGAVVGGPVGAVVGGVGGAAIGNSMSNHHYYHHHYAYYHHHYYHPY